MLVPGVEMLLVQVSEVLSVIMGVGVGLELLLMV